MSLSCSPQAQETENQNSPIQTGTENGSQSREQTWVWAAPWKRGNTHTETQDGTYKEKTQSETKVLRDQEKLERCKSSPGARAEIQLAPHILRRCVGGEKGGSSSVQEILEQGRMSYILSMARCYTVCRKPTVSVYPLLNRVNLSTRQWRKKSHKRMTDRLCVSSIRA